MVGEPADVLRLEACTYPPRVRRLLLRFLRARPEGRAAILPRPHRECSGSAITELVFELDDKSWHWTDLANALHNSVQKL
jgi:hypothetical protein